jgi:hypothetical protein
MILEAVVLVVGIASVASYETTGKGLADHAISTVAKKDCKIARVVHNEQVCQTEPIGTVSVEALPKRTVGNDGRTIDRANDVFAERARKSNESNNIR